MSSLLQGTHVCSAKRSAHIRHSRWYVRLRLCWTLVRKTEIKLDDNQTRDKLKVWPKSKPGQSVFTLDSSKVKRYWFQAPGSQHRRECTDSGRRWQAACHEQPSAVIPWTGSSMEGGPHESLDPSEIRTLTWDRGTSQAVTGNPFSESSRQAVSARIYGSYSASAAWRGTGRCHRLKQL